MAHPRQLAGSDRAVQDLSITVVVPARDRPDDLERCLTALGPDVPAVVVDDASDDPAAVADVCRRHGARLVSRSVNGGPAAARNEGLALADTDLVAFVDSDCTVTDRWLAGLVWLFEDESLGAVAPRVRPDGPPGAGALARYAAARSALDLGDQAGEVGPTRQVRYVPTAALVVRRSVIGSGFDTDLRVGEDVDLVWRLVERGCRVRYEPSVTVGHREPASWWELITRRYRYGTSAGPLARRHPGTMAPVELRPWATVTVALLLAGRPRTALCIAGASATALGIQVRGRGVPSWLAVRWSGQAAWWTAIGIGRALTVVAGPVAVVAMFRGRWRRAAAVLVLAPVAVEWSRRRPALDPVRWSLASLADDLAYGAGVWAGCLRARSFGPLIPKVRLAQGEGDAAQHAGGRASGVRMSGDGRVDRWAGPSTS